MALKWECDRCGTLEDKVMVEVNIPHLPPRGAYTDVDSTDTFKRNLCFQCHNKLHEFMQRLPKKVVSHSLP